MNKYSLQQCQHRSHKRFCSSVRANNSEFGCRWNILVTLHINKINSEKLLKPNLKLVFFVVVSFTWNSVRGTALTPCCNLPRESQSDAIMFPLRWQHPSIRTAQIIPTGAPALTCLSVRSRCVLRTCVSLSPNFLTGRVVFLFFFGGC